MRWATVQDPKGQDEWFEDYVRLALATPAPTLPPKAQRLGAVDSVWFETEPGVAFIHTIGGSIDDRTLVEHIVRGQLAACNIKQAEYDPENRAEDMRREAGWDDIMAKAQRLRAAGQVRLLRNGYNNIVGQVQGDHGDYQTEIMRQDPNSRVITQWTCECPWDQYAFQRTRQWKKYEARPCSHVLATFWQSQATPLDEDVHPGAQGMQPGQQGQLFTPPPGQPPTPGMGAAPMGQMPPQGQQMQIPGLYPGLAQGTPPMPSTAIPMGPDIIPPFPMEQMQGQPVANPASVPGLRQPSPTNPVQYPGGTFSKVLDWDFAGRSDTLSVVTKTAAFTNGQMVATKHDDWGTWVGRSTEHGAGQPCKIPQGSVGEVMGTDPSGMVEVLFMNPAIGVNKNGPMEPWGATAWFFESELVPRPDIQPPGPAIKRKR